MAKWNIFRKSKPKNSLLFFQVVFPGDMVFGVTAASVREAEEMVCTEIFHNQTIPGLPSSKTLSKDEVTSKFPNISVKKIKEKGIWYPA